MENIYHTIRGKTKSPRTLESNFKDPYRLQNLIFLEDEHYGRIHCKFHFFSSARKPWVTVCNSQASSFEHGHATAADFQTNLSFPFPSFPFLSLPFPFFPVLSLSFPSFPFFPFLSLSFPSFPFLSLPFQSFPFLALPFSFLSLPFPSFPLLSLSFFPECVARVPVSLWGSGGWGCVRSTLPNRPQPFVTVREIAIWPCLALLRFAWQAWHSDVFPWASPIDSNQYSQTKINNFYWFRAWLFQ